MVNKDSAVVWPFILNFSPSASNININNLLKNMNAGALLKEFVKVNCPSDTVQGAIFMR